MVIADTGDVLTYRELDQGSNRMAQLLRSLGLEPGDRIAVIESTVVERGWAATGELVPYPVEVTATLSAAARNTERH